MGHMLDLSEETKEDNIKICLEYLKRMAKIGVWLEMEIGITGGEEDGVNNEHVHNSALYTQPEDIWTFTRRLALSRPTLALPLPLAMCTVCTSLATLSCVLSFLRCTRTTSVSSSRLTRRTLCCLSSTVARAQRSMRSPRPLNTVW